MRLHSASIDDGARLDISAEGFWGHQYQYVFFDVRVFYPLSSTNRSRSLMACYRENEEIKKQKYDQCIREVEHASFSPLIFSTSGGFGPISTLFIKRLSHLHAEKFQRPYSVVVNFIKCRYSFSILKSALRCLCGSRSKPHHIDSVDFCRVISDARLGSFWQLLFLLLLFLCLQLFVTSSSYSYPILLYPNFIFSAPLLKIMLKGMVTLFNWTIVHGQKGKIGRFWK